MVERYYLFGSTSDDISMVGASLASALGLEFEARTSSYKGGRYLKLRSDEFRKLTVEKNWTDDEGYQVEPDFPRHSVLVYVANPSPNVLTTLETVLALDRLRMEELE